MLESHAVISHDLDDCLLRHAVGVYLFYNASTGQCCSLTEGRSPIHTYAAPPIMHPIPWYPCQLMIVRPITVGGRSRECRHSSLAKESRSMNRKIKMKGVDAALLKFPIEPYSLLQARGFYFFPLAPDVEPISPFDIVLVRPPI